MNETELLIALATQQNTMFCELVGVLAEANNQDNANEAEEIEAATAMPRRVWMHKRFGRFWEKDVPDNDEAFFKESFRMEKASFSLLVNRLGVLKKKNTPFRYAIAYEKRIAIALYTLGSAAEYRTVARLFGVSPNSVCNILHEFCRAFVAEFAEDYLPKDFLNESMVDENVAGFEALGFPQCIGAIDGCHIEIKPAAEEATDHFNYKGWYSIILFACVDYRFVYVNVGCPGRCSDSTIYRNSDLKKMVETSPLIEQKAKELCGTQVPLLLIGDSAFKFSRTVMKPYAFSTAASEKQKTFNYNLSKARRVVENAFGHIKARFRRIGKGLDSRPRHNSTIIMCCCILHNLLNTHNSDINASWQDAANSNRIQPEQSNLASDFECPPEVIRSAIAESMIL